MYSIVGERRTYTVCISYTALIVNLVTKRTYSWQKKKKKIKNKQKNKTKESMPFNFFHSVNKSVFLTVMFLSLYHGDQP